jgi:hypothetical protein
MAIKNLRKNMERNHNVQDTITFEGSLKKKRGQLVNLYMNYYGIR